MCVCGGGGYPTPFPELLHFILEMYFIMLSVKQGGIKCHFLSLWYDSTWDWTPVSRAIGKHYHLYLYIKFQAIKVIVIILIIYNKNVIISNKKQHLIYQIK